MADAWLKLATLGAVWGKLKAVNVLLLLPHLYCDFSRIVLSLKSMLV